MPTFSTEKCKEGSGDWVDKPCRCQFLVKEVDDDFASHESQPEYQLELEVVASSEPDQVGKFMHKDKGGRIFIKGGGVSKLFELACATGVLDRNYLKQQLEAKADVDFEPKDMEGRSFITDVVFNPGKNDPEKKYANLGGASGFTFYALGDEEVDNFPLDEHTASYAKQPGTGMLLTRNSVWRKRGTPKAGAMNGKPASSAPKNSPPAGQRQPSQQRQAQKPPELEEIPF